MTADAYGSILGLIQQGTGNNNNTWGTTFNASFATPDERAIAGVNTISTTSGTVDLSTTVPPAGLRLDVDAIQLLTGALVGDLTIKIPNVSKRTMFINATSGNFNAFVQIPGGTSPNGLRQLPQGQKVEIICDGNGKLYRGDGHQIGNFVHHGGTTAPSGALVCNGSSLLRTAFPDLFNAIGTTWGAVDGTHFTLPLLTDTNRFLRAADGSTILVGAYQASQNKTHTHTGSGTTSTESADHSHTFSGTSSTESVPHSHAGSVSVAGTTDSQGSHTHTSPVTDPGHAHSIPLSNGGQPVTVGNGSAGTGVTANATTTGTATTGISVTIGSSGAHTHNVSASGSYTTGTESANHTHTYSGTTSGISATHTHTYSFTTSTGSADGAEARPESAAVLICIRY